jgi:ribose transport system ATP-binding protein
VATKQQIFKIIWNLSKQGISSLIVSSELEELIEVCTRIVLMRDGLLCGEIDMDNLNADDIYLAAMGEEI